MAHAGSIWTTFGDCEMPFQGDSMCKGWLESKEAEDDSIGKCRDSCCIRISQTGEAKNTLTRQTLTPLSFALPRRLYVYASHSL